ncbi:glycine zipper 2TM domain-containing protein [Dyella choica]|uniref:Glycine zipper 2TM domain-containing protein n=2 Tax=Dyella choica TaxID=1927959 RepID=A0A432MAS5_9GAMM|nr:glycine zipper 2TM domain-containing protein [Dyella choica]
MRRPASLALIGCLMMSGAGVASVQNSNTPAAAPHQVCHKVRVQDRPKDSHQIAGTLIGAAAGGLLGNQFGGGKGKVLTTAGGVVAGGYAGKKVQESHQQNNPTYHYEERCYESRQ